MQQSLAQAQNLPIWRALIGANEQSLITLPSEATVAQAVGLMRERNVGDVIIVEDLDGEPFPVGIVTDRDLALDVLAQCVDPENLKVSAVMKKYLVTCPESAGIFEMIRIMKEEGISRLPLVSETGTLKGIVNSKNLMQLLVEGLHDLSHMAGGSEIKDKPFQH